MPEQGERGSPETVQAVMLHQEITDLFNSHDPAVIKGGREVALLTGQMKGRGEHVREEFDVGVSRVILEGVLVYHIRFKDALDPDATIEGINIYPEKATFGLVDAPSAELEEIMFVRDMLSLTAFDNMGATRIAMDVQPIVDAGDEAMDRFMRGED